MRVPNDLRDRYAYHFTAINNLPTIIKYGLIATNEKRRINLAHAPIAASNIQERRSAMKVPYRPGGVVHDYVPFYFCKRSPMLRAVLNQGWADQWDIIYIAIPITIIERATCVFTDASANTTSLPNFHNNPAKLAKINWDAIDTWRWGRQHDVPGQIPVRQAKQAELFVYRRVAPEFFSQIIVWGEQQETQIRNMYSSLGKTPPNIEFGFRDFYFLNDDGTSAVQSVPTSPSGNYRPWRSSEHESPIDDSDFDKLIQAYESEIRSDAQNQEDADDRHYW